MPLKGRQLATRVRRPADPGRDRGGRPFIPGAAGGLHGPPSLLFTLISCRGPSPSPSRGSSSVPSSSSSSIFHTVLEVESFTAAVVVVFVVVIKAHFFRTWHSHFHARKGRGGKEVWAINAKKGKRIGSVSSYTRHSTLTRTGIWVKACFFSSRERRERLYRH